MAVDYAGNPVPAQACVYQALVLGTWTFVRCAPETAHYDGLIVAIGGASRVANQPHPRGGIGVFFAAQSAHNLRSELDGPANATNMRTCVTAAIEALRIVGDVVAQDGGGGDAIPWLAEGPLRQLVLKTDSLALHEVMTEKMLRWRANGFTNAHGHEIVDADLFRALDGRIAGLANGGVTVQFWLVGKKENMEAIQLAKDPLYAVCMCELARSSLAKVLYVGGR
jgi:ribonuclease HI